MRTKSLKLLLTAFCATAAIQYLGQTEDTVRRRVRGKNKKFPTKNLKMLGMSQHISICGKNKTPDFLLPLLQGKKGIVGNSERLWMKILSRSQN